MRARICRVCGRLYYDGELECANDENKTTPIDNVVTVCRRSGFEIKGDY